MYLISDEACCLHRPRSYNANVQQLQFHDPGILKWLGMQQTQRDIKNARHLPLIFKHASRERVRKSGEIWSLAAFRQWADLI